MAKTKQVKLTNAKAMHEELERSRRYVIYSGEGIPSTLTNSLECAYEAERKLNEALERLKPVIDLQRDDVRFNRSNLEKYSEIVEDCTIYFKQSINCINDQISEILEALEYLNDYPGNSLPPMTWE